MQKIPWFTAVKLSRDLWWFQKNGEKMMEKRMKKEGQVDFRIALINTDIFWTEG